MHLSKSLGSVQVLQLIAQGWHSLAVVLFADPVGQVEKHRFIVNPDSLRNFIEKSWILYASLLSEQEEQEASHSAHFSV